MSFLRACTTRRRAAPRRQLLRRRPRVRESGPREDVARPCNAIDAAVLVVPWPAPSLSTASQPPLVPQLYGKSRTVVLSRAIDLSRFAGRAAPGPGRAGPGRPSAPSGWNDGLSAWCATSASRHKGSALSTTHRSLAAACSAARRRAAMAGSCCPSATATEARRCPTTRARPFRGRMDDCIRSRRPASRDARRACRGTGEPLLRASKAAR